MPERWDQAVGGALVDEIRKGRAVFVVGTAIGCAPWSEVLAVMLRCARERERAAELRGAARDGGLDEVEQLIADGAWSRAAGYLGAILGEQATRTLIAELWRPPAELPAAARALARLPVRQIWTTTPGDLIEAALAEQPLAGRSLTRCFGSAARYAFPPRAARSALRQDEELAARWSALATRATLVFVGFEPGDPDVEVLVRELPAAAHPRHYMAARAAGPVWAEELAAEHGVSLFSLGDGDDALTSLLEELAERCGAGDGQNAEPPQPGEHDLAGWYAVLAANPHDPDARAAIDEIGRRAHVEGDHEQLVEALMARVEFEPEGAARAGHLLEMAEAFEDELGDRDRALTAAAAALREDPGNARALERAERLAATTGQWSDLVAEVAELSHALAEDPESAELAASMLMRLAGWYRDHLAHFEYAEASYRQVLRLDPDAAAARLGLGELLRRQQRWPELADLLEEQVEREVDREARADIYLGLGDLCETQLAEPSRAADAFERATQLDAGGDDALAALERLHRRAERWGKLADVLERRADRFEAIGQAGRAAATRRELATVRAEKLGDLDGAIQKYESALAHAPRDVATLRALVELYERTGRLSDYFTALEQLAGASPERERAPLYRRLAVELEEREDGRVRAIDCYRKVIALEPRAEDAHRALERHLTAECNWEELCEVYTRHAAELDGSARAALIAEMAGVLDRELEAPGRAIEAYQDALAYDPCFEPALAGLFELYRRAASWERALEIALERAENAGDGSRSGAERWVEAGEIAAQKLGRAAAAQSCYERALALVPGHLAALIGMAGIERSRGKWGNAARFLCEAAESSRQHSQRVSLFFDAAEISANQLGDENRALALLQRVLEIEPDHHAAGQRAADMLVRQERWQEAMPILEMLARSADGDGSAEVARREGELGRVCASLGYHDRAAAHYRLATAADPELVGAELGLIDALWSHVLELSGDDAQPLWTELGEVCKSALDRHIERLSPGEEVELSFRLGRTERALGRGREALGWLRTACELAPERGDIRAVLVDVASELGEWEEILRLRQAELDRTDEPTEKKRLLIEIAALQSGKLGHRDEAMVSYRRALEVEPDSPALLHRLLDLESEAENWRNALDILDAIAAITSDAERRARYRHAAAMIARDELDDRELAVARLQAALGDSPGDERSFEALSGLLRELVRWPELAAAHRLVLKHLGEQAAPGRLLALWGELAEICLTHLGDREAAIAAYEVVATLAPEDLERRELLANLYLEAGEGRRRDALEELHHLLERDPDRVELYLALAELYAAEEEQDASYLLAQALVLLDAAQPQQRELYEKHRPTALLTGHRRLTEELWTRALPHPREERHLSALFSSLFPALPGASAQPLSAYGLVPRGAVDADQDHRAPARVFQYAVDLTGIDPRPLFYLQAEGEGGLRIANAAERGELCPAMVCAPPMLGESDERELAFELGQKLCYLRPERYPYCAYPTLPRLLDAVRGALAASTPHGNSASGDAARVAAYLSKVVPTAMLAQVGAVGEALAGGSLEQQVAEWRAGAELSAARLGLVLCNDLEVAARRLAIDPGASATQSVKERLRELVVFSVSPGYMAIRKHLGLAIAGG